MNSEHRTILNIVARDIEHILLPSIDSANVKFIASTMKTLLDRIAQQAAVADPVSAPGPRTADWAGLLEWAEAEEHRTLTGEQASRESAWKQSGSGQRAASDAATQRMKPVEPGQLLSYLRSRPGYGWVEQCQVSQAPGGFSKDTFLINVRGQGRDEGQVLRRDQSFRALLSSVVDEHNVLATLAASGFPVPRPVWVEPDSSQFGAAVLATTRLTGSADSARWSSDPATAKAVLTGAAQLLARIHAFPVDNLQSQGSGAPGSRGDTPRAQAEDLRSYWETIASAPNPLMERVLDWLRDSAPEQFARRAIVHGDFGFHNLLVDGTTITGLLDWEFWHVGDAREDLAYTRSFVERVMKWDEFRTIYEAAGGCSSDPRADQFYSVLGGTRVSLGCYAFQHALRHTPDKLDSKMVYIGQSFGYRFLIDAAKVASISVLDSK